jgi:hypothetical protein
MPYALCPMPYALLAAHVTPERRYNSLFNTTVNPSSPFQLSIFQISPRQIGSG